MALHLAKHNGYLPILGLVCKGDIIEYTGIKRMWLEPVKGAKVSEEAVNRKEVIAELKDLGVPFYKGATTEQLSAMLSEHKKAAA